MKSRKQIIADSLFMIFTLAAVFLINLFLVAQYNVSNGDFFKIGIPFTLSAIVPAYILIWILFGV